MTFASRLTDSFDILMLSAEQTGNLKTRQIVGQKHTRNGIRNREHVIHIERKNRGYFSGSLCSDFMMSLLLSMRDTPVPRSTCLQTPLRDAAVSNQWHALSHR